MPPVMVSDITSFMFSLPIFLSNPDHVASAEVFTFQVCFALWLMTRTAISDHNVAE